MNLQDALAAIRDLEALPLPRRRHLAILVADAPTDAERARLVFVARDENRRVREQAEADLKARYAARAAMADYNAEHAADEPERPVRVRRWEGDGITYPEPRPLTISWTTPTKAAPEQMPSKRRPLNGPVRHHGSSPGRNETPKPKAKPEPKPKTEPEHGTLTRYQKPWYCRCPLCREVKRESNARHNAKRAEQNPKHGTTHAYNGSAKRAPCRCEECKAAKVISNAKARETMKMKKRSAQSPE